MKVKQILGGISAIGLALGGLIAAGKSGFGKSLGVDPCNGEDPLKLDDLGDLETSEEEETEPEETEQEEKE